MIKIRNVLQGDINGSTILFACILALDNLDTQVLVESLRVHSPRLAAKEIVGSGF